MLTTDCDQVTRTNYHHDPAHQWHWLANTLEKARAQHKTVIIFG